MEEVLAPLFRAQKTASWLEKFEEIGVPAGPVLSIAEMHEDPHALARDMIVETDHRSAGRVKTIGHPVKYSQTPAGVRQPAPIRGQHTKEILSELGYDESMIEKFISDGSAFEDDTA